MKMLPISIFFIKTVEIEMMMNYIFFEIDLNKNGKKKLSYMSI